tara:strand:+ start:24995 stop:25219 length:225 start_codon:yes stop_codon:yes gene_type:complete
VLISIHCSSNSIDPKGEQYFVGIFFKNAKTAVAKIPDVTSGNTGSIELGGFDYFIFPWRLMMFFKAFIKFLMCW